MRWLFGGEFLMARLIIERDAFRLVGSGDSSQSSAASLRSGRLAHCRGCPHSPEPKVL